MGRAVDNDQLQPLIDNDLPDGNDTFSPAAIVYQGDAAVIEAEEKRLTFWQAKVALAQAFFAGLADFFIIFGGAIPYVFQYVEIYHRKNAQGFSLFVCLVLCVANILRILFWVGKRFEWQLLAQSVVMFTAMIIMLEISTRMNRKHTPKALRKSVIVGPSS
ncbi:unnamed protein product, partial [Mesorhabditis spiculigera]